MGHFVSFEMSYTLLHLLWEICLDGQDQSSVKLEGSAIQPQMDYLSP